MLVKEFLDILATKPTATLRFEYNPGEAVAGGFHVTEIKNTTYETIDCGNSLHTWNEVIVQLWVPGDAPVEAKPMTAGKFLQIWDLVDGRLRLDRDAEIRIEYGDAQTRTALYHVEAIAEADGSMSIALAPQRTLCKPREILVPVNPGSDQLADACCGPTNETVLPLPQRQGSSGAAGCC